jgi:hypothetical protein
LRGVRHAAAASISSERNQDCAGSVAARRCQAIDTVSAKSIGNGVTATRAVAAISSATRRGTVATVVDYPDGRLAIRYRGLDLPYTTFDKLRQVSQATIVENKHLGAVLSHIRERQLERAEARSHKAPRRQGQVSHMFKVG